MPSISYGAGAYRRTTLPELKLVNMFVESVKTSEGGVALMSRPGLATFTTNAAGPINGIYSKRGTLSGALFSINNTTLYSDTNSLGSVVGIGSGRASWAGSSTEIVVTRGGTAFSYTVADGLDAIAFPDSANVTAVDYIGSLFVYVRASSHKFYWSDPLDGRTVDALNFASAEREPDLLLDVKALGDNIWLFGQSTIECWAHTGDADLPFTRFEQIAFDKGILDTGLAVKADNSIIFIGSTGSVYRIGEVPERISDHGIEERILASTNKKMFAFQYEGHEFVAIRLDSVTMLVDLATQEWCEFQTNGGNWIAADATMVGPTAYLGHSTGGQIMTFSGWQDLGVDMERRFTFVQALDAPISINSLKLWCNSGHVDGAEVEVRLSDDAGNTFGSWEASDFGTEYRSVAEWRAKGMFDFPGLLGEARCSDNCDFRMSAIKLNDPKGGRARG